MSYEWSYAPTNRAKCKGKCGEKIEKGAIRLATSSEVADYSIASYRCLKCVTDKQFHNMVSKVGSIESVTGWDTLSAKDQAAVRKQAGIKPAAKGAAKAAASPARKAKAKPEPKPKPKAAAGRAAKAKPALKRKVARGKTVMIAGHGAFGVENIRTCCEFSTKKIYLVCRRKNLACPRVCSWLANHSNPPISGALFMESMVPAYQLIGFDPWEYHSVMANAQRTSAHINQKSRFGIGDVYFLALSMGKCEVVVDDVKRLSPGKVHLESGRDLKVDTILKVFGFTGLYEVDRLLKIKTMHGWWAEGDNRRHIASENPGVYAGNFASTSLSPGAYSWSQTATHMMWHPKDWLRLMQSSQLPQNVADDSISRPAYVLDAKTGLTMQFTIPSICPSLGELQMNNGNVKRQKQLLCHPLRKFLEECASEWDEYGKAWKAEDPSLKDPPPYPYTQKMVEDYLRRSEQ